jgi:hypothetical protein
MATTTGDTVGTPSNDQVIKNGDLVLKDANNRELLRLDGQTGDIRIKDPNGNTIIHLQANGANASLGGFGEDGDLVLYRSTAKQHDLKIASIHLDGQNGNLWLGGGGASGGLVLRRKDGEQALYLSAEDGTIYAGKSGQDGQILLQKATGEATIVMNAASSNISVGGKNADGDIVLKDPNDVGRIHLTGGGGQTNKTARVVINGVEGAIRAGDNGKDGNILVRNAKGELMIHLDGSKGDIILQNADCAEDFDVTSHERIEPGTVLVIEQDDGLRQSTEAYDKRVAGVVSGAGDYKPGIVLDKKPSRGNRLPVALMGKVYCKVDAQYSAIETGDLLTTSPTPGHAMKASDPLKAFGAVIGKALRPLREGTSLIPVLVALQ